MIVSVVHVERAKFPCCFFLLFFFIVFYCTFKMMMIIIVIKIFLSKSCIVLYLLFHTYR